MTSQMTRDRLVADYLRRLDRQLARAPRRAAAELREQIAAHLDEAVPPDASEATVRTALVHLGEPEDIVAEITPPASPARATRASSDVVAWLLLSVGSLVLPVIGWLAGAVLLAMSPRYSHGQKTLVLGVWPFGPFLLPGVLIALPTGYHLPTAVGMPLVAVLFLAPIAVMVWVGSHPRGA